MHDRHSRAYAQPPPDGHSLADERAAHRYPVEGAVGRAVRVRQRILAVFLPVTAVLYVGCEALDPKARTSWSPIRPWRSSCCPSQRPDVITGAVLRFLESVKGRA
jgi:hypothetical protein